MTHEAAVSKAKEVAEGTLALAARQSDKEGRFSSESVEATTTCDSGRWGARWVRFDERQAHLLRNSDRAPKPEVEAPETDSE